LSNTVNEIVILSPYDMPADVIYTRTRTQTNGTDIGDSTQLLPIRWRHYFRFRCWTCSSI